MVRRKNFAFLNLAISFLACSFAVGEEAKIPVASSACATPIRLQSYSPIKSGNRAVTASGTEPAVDQHARSHSVLEPRLNSDTSANQPVTPLRPLPIQRQKNANASEQATKLSPPKPHATARNSKSPQNETDAMSLAIEERPENSMEARNTNLTNAASAQDTGANISFTFTDASIEAEIDQQRRQQTITAPAKTKSADRLLDNQQQPKPTAADRLASNIPYATDVEAIVVHPPMVQPFNPNQHTFVIENRGARKAKDVTVTITVPEFARIVGALPTHSTISKNLASFHLGQINAGENIQVHVTAVSGNEQAVSFVANVSAELSYSFSPIADAANRRLENVSYDSKAKISHRARAAALIKNPFVDSRDSSNASYLR